MGNLWGSFTCNIDFSYIWAGYPVAPWVSLRKYCYTTCHVGKSLSCWNTLLHIFSHLQNASILFSRSSRHTFRFCQILQNMNAPFAILHKVKQDLGLKYSAWKRLWSWLCFILSLAWSLRVNIGQLGGGESVCSLSEVYTQILATYLTYNMPKS